MKLERDLNHTSTAMAAARMDYGPAEDNILIQLLSAGFSLAGAADAAAYR